MMNGMNWLYLILNCCWYRLGLESLKLIKISIVVRDVSGMQFIKLGISSILFKSNKL